MSDKMRTLLKCLPNDFEFKVGVVCPEDEESLKGPLLAAQQNILMPVLIGDVKKIKQLANRLSLDIMQYECVHLPEHAAAAAHAVTLAKEGKIHALMKGFLHTDVFMPAVVHRETGLRTNRRMSHCMLSDLPHFPKLLIISDVALNIEPDIVIKKDIVQHAIDLSLSLGISKPKVALLSSVNTPSQKVKSSLDCEALCQMAEKNDISGGELYGPIQFDAAISQDIARIKKIDSAVAGDPDVLVVPDLDSGNILIKALEFSAGATCYGIVLGAAVPIILTSRGADAAARVGSCMLAKFYTEFVKNKKE